MPAIIKQKYRTKEAVGRHLEVDPSAILEVRTEVTFVCECGRPEHTFQFIQEEVKDSPEALPEDFFGCLTLLRTYVNPSLAEKDPGKYLFFTPQCLAEWLLNTYKPHPTPKELPAASPGKLVELYPKKQSRVVVTETPEGGKKVELTQAKEEAKYEN